MAKSKQTEPEPIDVSLIMQEIRQTIAEKRANGEYRELVQKLEQLNVHELPEHKATPDDLSSYRLTNQYHLPVSHRGGIGGRLANLAIEKLFGAVRLFTEKIVGRQEKVNFKLAEEIGQLQQRLSSLEANVRNNNHALAEVKLDLEEAATMRKEGRELLNELSGKQSRIDKRLSDLENEDLDIDYVAFENKFRGDNQEISRRQKAYLPFFHECTNVMDIGCGRGEFIELLHSNGSGAFGVEIDPGMVQICKDKSLNVMESDALSYLHSIPDASLDGITAFQVVEHLSYQYLIQLINQAYQKLMPGKYLVMETIHTLTAVALTSNYYLDPTHKHPVHPQTLRFFCEQAGFDKFEMIYSSEVPESSQLKLVKENSDTDRLINENFKNLNLFLYGPQDYALIARKG